MHDIISRTVPAASQPVIDKPGKGAFHATDLPSILQVYTRGSTRLMVHRRHDRSAGDQHHRPRSQ